MRILLLEDSPIVREAMAGLLIRTFGAVEIVPGESAGPSGWTAGGPPHLTIVNICRFPSPGDPAVARLVGQTAPSPVVVVDAHARPQCGRAARAAGCRGYIPLTTAGDRIAAALKLILAGGEYHPPFDIDAEAAPPASRTLSARQREVAKRLAEGRTNREIASELGIAVPTVKLHVHAILSAIGARNRTEAALWARSSLQAAEA